MIYGKVGHYRLVERESFISLTISLTNITVAPSNLNIRLFVGMDVFSNSSKFQYDSTYKSSDMTF